MSTKNELWGIEFSHLKGSKPQNIKELVYALEL